jgi:hypothetical protein
MPLIQRSTDAASRNRPVVMAVRDSVRDLRRASRARCASDARLHPTTGDRWTNNARELQLSCGVRGRLANFYIHGARWPHGGCDRLGRFDDGTLHIDQRAHLEPRRTQ